MRKWTSASTTRDIVAVYSLCWGASWLLCLFIVLLNRENMLAYFDVFDYTASLSFVASGLMLAIFFGILFAGFYFGSMRMTAKLWYADRLKTNICSVTSAVLLCVLQLLAVRSTLAGQEIVIVLPFALADFVAAFVTVRFLR